ncbi:MAG: RNA polymerase sigma factor [Planctomycetota bacterium]
MTSSSDAGSAAGGPLDAVRLLDDLDFVRGLARALCRDAHVAEDVAQDVMVAALELRGEAVENRRGWLARVVRNLAAKRWRGDARRQAREVERVGATAVEVPTPAEVCEQEQVRKDVVSCVMDLPPMFRDVVLLRYYRGLDTKTCSARLGIPEGTVRTRLRRGLDALRGSLDRRFGGEGRGRERWMTALVPLCGGGDWLGGAAAAAAGRREAGASQVLASSRSGRVAAYWIGLAVAAATIAMVMTISRNDTEPPRSAASTPPLDGAASTAAAMPRASQARVHDSDAIGLQPMSRRSAVAHAVHIRGRVVSPIDYQPIASALVRATLLAPLLPGQQPVELPTAVTADDGTFVIFPDTSTWSPTTLDRFEIEMVAGTKDVLSDLTRFELRHEEHYQPRPFVVVVDSQDLMDPVPLATLVAKPREGVWGQVLQPNGQPCGRAIVGVEQHRMTVDCDGYGCFNLFGGDTLGQPAGAVVRAYHPMFGLSAPMQLEPKAFGVVGPLVFREPSRVVVGRLQHRDGEPVVGATVYLEESMVPDPQDAPRPVASSVGYVSFSRWLPDISVKTDSHGNYRLVAPGPGSFCVAARIRHVYGRSECVGRSRWFEAGVGTQRINFDVSCRTIRLLSDAQEHGRRNVGLGAGIVRLGTLYVWSGALARRAEERYGQCRTNEELQAFLGGASRRQTVRGDSGQIDGLELFAMSDPGFFLLEVPDGGRPLRYGACLVRPADFACTVVLR